MLQKEHIEGSWIQIYSDSQIKSKSSYRLAMSLVWLWLDLTHQGEITRYWLDCSDRDLIWLWHTVWIVIWSDYDIPTVWTQLYSENDDEIALKKFKNVDSFYTTFSQFLSFSERQKLCETPEASHLQIFDIFNGIVSSDWTMFLKSFSFFSVRWIK